MSQCQRILEVLSDHEFHTSEELYRRLGGMVLHSRIADLRKQGHTILGEHVPGKTGTQGYRYRLEPSDTRARVFGQPVTNVTAEYLRKMSVEAASIASGQLFVEVSWEPENAA